MRKILKLTIKITGDLRKIGRDALSERYECVIIEVQGPDDICGLW